MSFAGVSKCDETDIKTTEIRSPNWSPIHSPNSHQTVYSESFPDNVITGKERNSRSQDQEKNF
jgi:hypothetical protein